MKCEKTNDESMLRYVADLASDEERESLERHLAECRGCRRAVDALMAQERLLKNLMRRLSSRGDVADAVMKRLSRPRVPLLRTLLGTAAAVAAVVMLVLLFGGPAQPTEVAVAPAGGVEFRPRYDPITALRFPSPVKTEPQLLKREADGVD